MGVDGIQDDQVLIDGEAPHLCARATPLIHLIAEFPNEVAGPRIEGLHHVAGIRDIHRPVVDHRRRL